MDDFAGSGPDAIEGEAIPLSGYVPAVDGYARKLIARIERNHRDVEAVVALRAHYERHADHPSLANLLEGYAATLRDDPGAAEALTQAAAAVLRSPIADRARAQRLLERALERHPAHEPALLAMETLLQTRGEHVALERCLARVAEQLDRRAADPKLRASVHYRLGQLYERSMRRLGRAITHYRSAVELDPALTPAIAAARGIYITAGKADAAADMFELELAATQEATARYALLLALAEHKHEALFDLEGAVLALRRALRVDPDGMKALQRLAELLRKRAKTPGNTTAMTDRARAAELYYQLARKVARSAARQHLEACLALSDVHAGAQRMLAELDAYGAEPEGVALGERSQAEIDLRSTARLVPVGGRPRSIPPEARRPERDAADSPAVVDVSAWLDEDDQVTLVDDEVGTHRMVPLTDRPPNEPPV